MWAGEHWYRLLDTPVRVQFQDQEAGERLRHLLGYFALPERVPVRGRDTFSLVGNEEGGRWKAYRDCRLIGSSEDPDQAILHLLAHLNRAAVDGYGGLAVHAAVIALGRGAIALPAVSGGGKTTIAAACLRAGFEYLSDEALCVDITSAAVIPYPKPLLLTTWSRQVLEIGTSDERSVDEVALTAEDLGGRAVTDPVPLVHVVLPERGVDEAKLEEIPRSQAVAALLRLSFNHYVHGETAFRLATQLAAESRTWRLEYSDPMKAARLLSNRLQDSR